jgi:two-component system, OmpR family, phosphate regulon sensor histidine kinase PhoR
MTLNIRSKMFAASLALIAASVVAAELYLRPAIEDNLQNRIRDDLLVRLALVQHSAEGFPGRDPAAWDALADDLGSRAKARVSFIAPDGSVLGDSEVALADLSHLENHRARPEISRALTGTPGLSTRWSATVHDRLMYAAGPLPMRAGGVGAARVAVPLVDVDAAVRDLRRLLLAALVVSLIVAVVISSAAAHVLSGALRNMIEVARRMSAGDLEVRTRAAGRDDIAELGRALDRLAGSLSATLTELRGERDLLGRILESMREGVLVLDGDRRILLVNPALRSTLLLAPEQGIEGKAPIELVRNAELQAIVDRTFASAGTTSGEIETGTLQPRRLLVHASPLPAAGQEPPGLLAVFVDVTEIRRLETLRKDFVANVSHELRTPVTAVRSAIETLRHTLPRDPAASARFIDMIDRNAQRLGSLVEDLLDLSRIESREYHPDLQALPVRPAVEQVIGLLRSKAEAKGLRLVVDIPADPPEARGDRRAVEQVLTNLIDNAVKYCPTGALVTVRVRTQVDPTEDGSEVESVRFEVEDTGPGIEPRHLPRLFERFYRVDSGRSRDMGGTGLGLSIVKHLVEAMDGAVGVDSTPGRGSTFWFVLSRA